jgi:transcriptional regulator with XRE-family HTH domain
MTVFDPELLIISVSAQLDAARQEAKLSQCEMADRATLAPSTVNHALRCGDIRLSTLAKLAAATGRNVTVIIR